MGVMANPVFDAARTVLAVRDFQDKPLPEGLLDRLARHHTRIERTFHRCLKQLKALQAQRKREWGVTSDDMESHLRANAARLSVI